MGSDPMVDATDSEVRMCGGLYIPFAWNLGCGFVVSSSCGSHSRGRNRLENGGVGADETLALVEDTTMVRVVIGCGYVR